MKPRSSRSTTPSRHTVRGAAPMKTKSDDAGIAGRRRKDDVRPWIVRHGLQIRTVRDHERVARRGRELLNDAGDVEGNNVEAAGAMVERPQLEEVADPEGVVRDRLLRDEDCIAPHAEPPQHLGGAAADEIRVTKTRSVEERRRIDPERVLQVRPDVRVCVIERGRSRHAGDTSDGLLQIRRPTDDDVTAKRQLCVDPSLLIVGCGEDRKINRKREQQSHEDEAYQRFLRLFHNQPDLVNNVSPDALPASFRVKLVDPQKFPTPTGLFTIDKFGGWDKVNTDFFDETNGKVAKIEADLGVSTAG